MDLFFNVYAEHFTLGSQRQGNINTSLFIELFFKKERKNGKHWKNMQIRQQSENTETNWLNVLWIVTNAYIRRVQKIFVWRNAIHSGENNLRLWIWDKWDVDGFFKKVLCRSYSNVTSSFAEDLKTEKVLDPVRTVSQNTVVVSEK